MSLLKNKKIIIPGAIFIVALILLTVCDAFGIQAEKTWTVTVGEKAVIRVDSQEKGEKVIESFKNHYLTEGSEVQKVSVSPEMKAEKKKVTKTISKLPSYSKVTSAVKYLTKGTTAQKTYKVKKGDTAWGIAKKNDISLKQLQKLNPKKNLDVLQIGDKLKLNEVKPFATVTTKEKITSQKKIKRKVKYIKTKKLLEGKYKVKTKGRDGLKEVVGVYVKKNGKTVSTKILSETVLKKAKTKEVYKGTKPSKAAKGKKVANYALKFVGNPYKYGGTSLTNGCDCSGFVMSVYAHFGVSLPHGARSMESYGKHVSLKNARAGDIVIYTHHVAIYIGNGQVVHSRDERQGICVTSVGASVYSGQKVEDVRRIFY